MDSTPLERQDAAKVLLDIYFQKRCRRCGTPIVHQVYFQFAWSERADRVLQFTARFCASCYGPTRLLLYDEKNPRTSLTVLVWLLNGSLTDARYQFGEVSRLECYARRP